MSMISIETLTSVHIGSGEVLQQGTDFVQTTMDGDKCLAIVDPAKVLAVIGESNCHKWTAAIERHESTADVVRRFAPNAKAVDYAKRTILAWCKPRPTDTLKEHIHDGRGVPYIPGSSIKGAIRTAVLASLAGNVRDRERKIDSTRRDRNGKPFPDKKGHPKYQAEAKKVESELFGGSPNQDIFRFLQVGDAYFGNNYEVAIRMVNINERERNSYWDTEKSQLIEAIGPEDESTFRLKLNDEGYRLSKNAVAARPECLQSVTKLFETINLHTIHLLETEISYWEERKDSDDSEKVSDYIGRINEILTTAKQCKSGQQCVLRIGHGSGWRFMTGAWAEDFDNFDTLVVPASRPNYYNYEQYDFPKTRRVDDECELLGFVKLTNI